MSTSILIKRKLCELSETEARIEDTEIKESDGLYIKRTKQQTILFQSALGQYRTPVERVLDDLFIRDLTALITDYLHLVIYTKDPGTGCTVPRYVDVFSVSLERETVLGCYAIEAVMCSSPILTNSSFLQSGLFTVSTKEPNASWDNPFNVWEWKNGFRREPKRVVGDRLLFVTTNDSFPLKSPHFHVPQSDIAAWSYDWRNFSSRFYENGDDELWIAKGDVEKGRWTKGKVIFYAESTEIRSERDRNCTCCLHETKAISPARATASRIIAGVFDPRLPCCLRSGFYYVHSRGNLPMFSFVVNDFDVEMNTFKGRLHQRSQDEGHFVMTSGTFAVKNLEEFSICERNFVPSIQPIGDVKIDYLTDLVDIPFLGPRRPLGFSLEYNLDQNLPAKGRPVRVVKVDETVHPYDSSEDDEEDDEKE